MNGQFYQAVTYTFLQEQPSKTREAVQFQQSTRTDTGMRMRTTQNPPMAAFSIRKSSY